MEFENREHAINTYEAIFGKSTSKTFMFGNNILSSTDEI